MMKIGYRIPKWKNLTQKMEQAVDRIRSNRGWCTLGLCSIFILLGYPILDVSVGGFLLYGGTSISKYLSHRIEKDQLDSIDIDKIGFGMEKKTERSITDLIGEYVEDCFNRDVIFFRPINDGDFVDAKTEREMLEELLDSAASNMSPLMVKKLELYVGEGNVMKIVGRKCLTTVTIFVASHNHKLYDGHSSR